MKNAGAFPGFFIRAVDNKSAQGNVKLSNLGSFHFESSDFSEDLENASEPVIHQTQWTCPSRPGGKKETTCREQ